MKKGLIIAGVILVILAGFAVFFALQATPGHVLNSVRADRLEIVDGTVTIPEKYSVIDAEAFAGKGEFSKVIIKGDAQIRTAAFYGCPNLEEVVLEGACDIQSKAFASCPMLRVFTSKSAEGACAADALEGHGGVTAYCREGSEVLEVAKLNDINFKIIED